VWCVTTARRLIITGCCTMMILLGCGRGGTARCLTGSVIIAVQQNRVLVAPIMTQGVEMLIVQYFCSSLNNV
jgi:hypothetical protein